MVVANRADDHEVVAFGCGGLPDVAGRESDLWDAAFGLPASGDGTREFSVVRDDQDAGMRQEHSPKESQRRRQNQRRPPEGGRYKLNSNGDRT